MIGKLRVTTIWSVAEKGTEKVYIGRSSKHPSPLGNPYVINGYRDRDKACDMHEEYLTEVLNQGNSPIMDEMNRIGNLLLAGTNVDLQCYCAPKRCHGDYIKQIIDEHILEYQAQQEK
jgi:hypothetical protein